MRTGDLPGASLGSWPLTQPVTAPVKMSSRAAEHRKTMDTEVEGAYVLDAGL